ncbi:hypothetical protein OROHE_007324 [Orobanche hederae]
MVMMSLPLIITTTVSFTLICLFSYPVSVSSQPLQSFDYPTANLSSLWINEFDSNRSVRAGFSTVTSILLRGASDPVYSCGFYGDSSGIGTYLFSIFIVQTDSLGYISDSSSGRPQVVWSASRDNPVRENATLELTADGDLILTDADGTLAWSTYTAGKGVIGLNLTEFGNLILFDRNRSVIWQSFDHPSDCLLPGQILRSGMNLTANVSTNRSSDGGLLSVGITDRGFVASLFSHPPQVYFEIEKVTSCKFENGRLTMFRNGSEFTLPESSQPVYNASLVQYMKLGADGHLRVFTWPDQWMEAADLLSGTNGACGYPMVCGRFGICSSSGQCSCPREIFSLVDDKRPQLGCSADVPLMCNASDDHKFLDLQGISYFSFDEDIIGTDLDSCKNACLQNCSCKGVVFRRLRGSSYGNCSLPLEMFSLINLDIGNYPAGYNYSVSIKVQNSTVSHGRMSIALGLLMAITGGFFIAAVIGISCCIYHRKKRRCEEVEEAYLDEVPGMPTRFSFEELETLTGNFNKKLGEGGFGSVFEGLLSDGTRIAVKRLDGIGQVRKSFLAEVESIGSIHHNNLVRLIGFCAEKSHRLLVYEFMCNGSLERWIYCKSHETMLGWSQRRKIILDIAKGLAHLHEDCRKKIIHLDIKPQNILLDECYNAKLADFGLAKLIDRNQSNVVTTMRGTPGYLAPEWLSAVITEKVDVYSFGVVVLEIVSGRKIFEQSRPEEERYLLEVFNKRAGERRWQDLVDKCCLDVGSNVVQVEEMMEIAAWCLQGDHEKRPSMSVVIKILEGVVNVQRDINFSIVIPQVSSSAHPEATPLLPSVLSGPR